MSSKQNPDHHTKQRVVGRARLLEQDAGGSCHAHLRCFNIDRIIKSLASDSTRANCLSHMTPLQWAERPLEVDQATHLKACRASRYRGVEANIEFGTKPCTPKPAGLGYHTKQNPGCHTDEID